VLCAGDGVLCAAVRGLVCVQADRGTERWVEWSVCVCGGGGTCLHCSSRKITFSLTETKR
jgi:hypothetical protein